MIPPARPADSYSSPYLRLQRVAIIFDLAEAYVSCRTQQRPPPLSSLIARSLARRSSAPPEPRPWLQIPRICQDRSAEHSGASRWQSCLFAQLRERTRRNAPRRTISTAEAQLSQSAATVSNTSKLCLVAVVVSSLASVHFTPLEYSANSLA